MRSWQAENGHITCRWSVSDQRDAYNPEWMQKAKDVPSGYLPPIPDFASHSPFCGPEWFELH
jgi:hypothetical protein